MAAKIHGITYKLLCSKVGLKLVSSSTERPSISSILNKESNLKIAKFLYV